MSTGPDLAAEAALTVSGAARHLGVAQGTLRTWDRRHGLGASTRSPGGHRRYSLADLARLEAMRTFIQSGIPAAEAARLALTDRDPHLSARLGPPPRAETLVQAALELDALRLCSLLDKAVAHYGLEAAWEGTAVPALDRLGRASGTGHLAAEHMLSGCLLGTLLAVIARCPPPQSPRPVLLCCASDEQHVLAVHVLQAELAIRKVDVRQLGGRVPRPALRYAVGVLRPAAVFVWSQVAGTADPAVFAGLSEGTIPLAGGPGWEGHGTGQARHLRSLGAATKTLTELAFGS
jgi:DNA-binding transcriptional MerR regulator